jgi:osmotically-inducible protein OsmY
MYTIFKKLIFACCAALSVVAGSSAYATDSASQEVTEARQETQIWTTYALSPHLRAHDIKVSVHNGIATLTGTVEESVNKDLAKQIALGVSGIKEVDNKIMVQADNASPVRSSDRSYGDVIDDATVTATIKSKLVWSKHTDGLTIDVDTKSGKVTLMGTADSAAAKDFAGRLALNTRGVVSVDNRLVVNGTKPTVADNVKHSADVVEQKIDDGWITTKVKSTYLYSANVSGSNIDVTTVDGVVTLSGKASSGAERALAIELASNVRGVKSVKSQNLTVLK